MNGCELTKVEMNKIRVDHKNMVTTVIEKQHTMKLYIIAYNFLLVTNRACLDLFVYIKLERLHLIQFDKHIS